MATLHGHSLRHARASVAAALAVALTIAAAPFAAQAAASTTIDFTSSGYTTGAAKPAGQNGWWQAKAADFSLVDNSSFPSSGLPSGGRSLQFSNSTIPSGGAHLVSPPIDAAGEPSTGADSNTFEAQFTVASATGALQEGLGVDVALDGASRYGGVINLRHTATGLQIGSYWVPADAPDASLTSWRSKVFTTVNATVPHTVRVVAVFLDDQPDSFQVWVDNVLVSGGSGATTWEYYHDIAGTGGDQTVNELSFKSSASAPSADGLAYTSGLPTLPSAAGKGFLFSGISYGVSTSAPPLPTDPPTLPSAPSATPDASIDLADDSVTGGSLNFEASGFLAYENVYATIFSSPTFGGWFQADANGDVAGSVPLPSGLSYGSHTLELTGSVTGWVAASGFTKIPEPLPTDPPTLPSAPDASPDSTATLSLDGTSLDFSATGFLPYENVYATVFSTPTFGGWFQADIDGDLTGTVTLPSELAVGSHVLQLTGSVSDWIAAGSFAKAPPAIPTDPPVLPSAPDPTPDTEVEIEDDTVTGTESFSFSAGGFAPYENVYVTFFSTPVFGGWFQADADGVASGTVELPEGLPAGTHTLQLTGADSGWVASVEFELIAPAAVPPAVKPAAPLASTGTDAATIIALAGGLLLAGAAVLLIARMRRRA